MIRRDCEHSVEFMYRFKYFMNTTNMEYNMSNGNLIENEEKKL